MATYLELRGLYSNGDLMNRLEVACIVSAEAICTEDAGTTNHANRLVWAKNTFGNTRRTAELMLMALLAANKATAVGLITGASDATLQTAVDGAVNIFADGS